MRGRELKGIHFARRLLLSGLLSTGLLVWSLTLLLFSEAVYFSSEIAHWLQFAHAPVGTAGLGLLEQIFVNVQSGKHNHRQRWPDAAGMEKQVQAVLASQVDIQDGQVKFAGFQVFPRFADHPRGGNIESSFTQVERNEFTGRGFVVHNKYSREHKYVVVCCLWLRFVCAVDIDLLMPVVGG